MSPQNLTNVYNQNPTLQGQYTLQQYLDLFGGSSTPANTTTATTTTPTPTPTSVQPGIINANINQFQNQGGDGNGNFTGGKFGDLDLSTTKTEYRDVSDGKGGSTIEEFETAMTKGGMRKDIETNLNVTHGGLKAEPFAVSIFNALTGKEKYKGEYPEAGETIGTFSNRKGTNNYGIPFGDLNIFQKIKMDMSRNKELKQYAAELQKQKEIEEAFQAQKDAAKSAADRKNITQIQNYTGNPLSTYRMGRPASERNYTGGGAQANDPIGGFENKSGMGRTGYRYGGRASYFNGGIVSLRRR